MKTANVIANCEWRRASFGWTTPVIAIVCCWTSATFASAAGFNPQEKEESAEKQESEQIVVEQETDSSTDQKTEKKKVEWPQSEDGWYVVTPEGGNASFSVPTEPHSSNRDMVTVDDLPITVHLNVSVDSNKANLVFAWHDQGLPKQSGDVARTLNGAFVGALGMTLGEEISREEVRVHRYPGLDFQIGFIFKDQKMKMASRVALINGRVYQLSYIAPKDVFNEADHKKFIDSFKYLPPPEQPAPQKSDSGQPEKPGGQ